MLIRCHSKSLVDLVAVWGGRNITYTASKLTTGKKADQNCNTIINVQSGSWDILSNISSSGSTFISLIYENYCAILYTIFQHINGSSAFCVAIDRVDIYLLTSSKRLELFLLVYYSEKALNVAYQFSSPNN